MPVLTHVDDLTATQRLHESVYDGGQLLLTGGKVLNSADVDFLRKRCPNAQILVEDPILDALVAFGSDLIKGVADETRTHLISLLSGVQDAVAPRLLLRSMDSRGIEVAIGGVLEYIERNPVMSSALILKPGQDQQQLVSHAARVFYVSLVLGNAVRARVADAHQKRDWRRMLGPTLRIDLTALALGALFMDLGMWPIKEVFQQATPLTPEQAQMVRNHPIVSARALPLGTDETIRLIVETHHENYDGSGYPYGLRGDEIHIFARVLRIADAFAAATSGRLHRQALSPPRAIWEMTLGPYKQLYDPVLLKIFGSAIQPFPLGSKVQLNDGRHAVVVRYGQLSPFLPEILIAFDDQGQKLSRSEMEGPLKLEDRRDLTISAFDGEDVSDLYEHDMVLPSPSVSEFTTAFESMYTGLAATKAMPTGIRHFK